MAGADAGLELIILDHLTLPSQLALSINPSTAPDAICAVTCQGLCHIPVYLPVVCWTPHDIARVVFGKPEGSRIWLLATISPSSSAR